MFSHHFYGSQHNCGTLSLKHRRLLFYFTTPSLNKKDIELTKELGKSFAFFCYPDVTLEFIHLLEDDSSSDSSDDEKNIETARNPRSRPVSHGYCVWYTFKNSITVKDIQTVFEALQKRTHSIDLFITPPCFQEINQALKDFFKNPSENIRAKAYSFI